MSAFVYFDRNVYDFIHRRLNRIQDDFTENDFIILKSAIDSGEITVLLSLLDIDETIAIFDFDPKKAIDQIRFMLSLVDSYRFIKPHNMLISDDIRSFAKSGIASSSFSRNVNYLEKISFLGDPTQQDIDIIKQINANTQKTKMGFSSFMRDVKSKVQTEMEKYPGDKLSFLGFFNHISKLFAEDLAKQEGILDQCMKRGINNLLDVRSIRLYVGYSLSLLFAQFYEGNSQSSGDYYDQFHATVSSAADIFVTQDRKFKERLSRVQVKNYEVINLRELILRIK